MSPVLPPKPDKPETSSLQLSGNQFVEQTAESKEHAGIFRRAARNFGLLAPPIEHHHADRYTAAETLQGHGGAGLAAKPVAGLWICKVCSMIYDPKDGDPDS